VYWWADMDAALYQVRVLAFGPNRKPHFFRTTACFPRPMLQAVAIPSLFHRVALRHAILTNLFHPSARAVHIALLMRCVVKVGIVWITEPVNRFANVHEKLEQPPKKATARMSRTGANLALLRSVRRAAPCAPPQNAGTLAGEALCLNAIHIVVAIAMAGMCVPSAANANTALSNPLMCIVSLVDQKIPMRQVVSERVDEQLTYHFEAQGFRTATWAECIRGETKKLQYHTAKQCVESFKRIRRANATVVSIRKAKSIYQVQIQIVLYGDLNVSYRFKTGGPMPSLIDGVVVNRLS
jgi:hypothetical protein